MISFKVVERVLGVGPRKGQKGYGAEPKSQDKFSQNWLIERIVRETSLSEGDARNVLITLRNIIIEVVKLGGALDFEDDGERDRRDFGLIKTCPNIGSLERTHRQCTQKD